MNLNIPWIFETLYCSLVYLMLAVPSYKEPKQTQDNTLSLNEMLTLKLSRSCN